MGRWGSRTAYKVKEMTASARGTVENPGTGVTRQSRINRAFLDASMAELLRQIRYKGAWYGRTVVEAPKEFLSSQLCSTCGFVEAGLRLDEHRWTCGGCSAVHDRDDNAAKNLQAYGLRMTGIHPEGTGEVRAPGGKGKGPDRTRAEAVPARIGREREGRRERPEA